MPLYKQALGPGAPQLLHDLDWERTPFDKVASPQSLYRKKRKVRPRTSSGAEGLVAEVVQSMPPEAVVQLRDSFDTLINNRGVVWPASWQQCRAALLPKKPNWTNFGHLRPSVFLAIVQELFARVLLRLISPWATPKECGTFGFRRGYQPCELTRTLISVAEHCREWSRPGHIITTGLSKA